MDVKVLVYSTIPAQDYTEFTLIFPDHFEKYFKLDAYEVRALRCSEREVYERCAYDYFEQNGEPTDNIRLIFL